MLGGDFGQVGSRAVRPAIRAELDADAMDTHFPVQVVVGFLKLRQDRDGDVEFSQFIGSDGTESGILESAVKVQKCF